MNILFLTTFPPQHCGIATFSQDLINAIECTYGKQINISIGALIRGSEHFYFTVNVKYKINTDDTLALKIAAEKINQDSFDVICVQHEFGLFGGEMGDNIVNFLAILNKPVTITFHTVLPNPDSKRFSIINKICENATRLISMTKRSSEILQTDYKIPEEKIIHIPHGTHLTEWKDKQVLKEHYGIENKKVFSTFGLISRNKSIETAIEAMVEIRKEFPDSLYLIIGKTHPQVFANEGEKYRNYLESLVNKYDLNDNVQFINQYLDLDELLNYLALTDIYLFTSKDPNQAVSGTFLYAMSSGCPIISTSFVQAKEMLDEGTGVLINFNSPNELSIAAKRLLSDPELMKNMSMNAYHATRTSIWENVAISHSNLFSYIKGNNKGNLSPILPPISLHHFNKMTDDAGFIQFAKISTPDIESGYTVDDNARALIALCMFNQSFIDKSSIYLMKHYLDFVLNCQQTDGRFLNYLDKNHRFTSQNYSENLDDSNGRAIWSLGFTVGCGTALEPDLIWKLERAIIASLSWITELNSPRAIAFCIKGLSHFNKKNKIQSINELICLLGNKLAIRYFETRTEDWHWFEESLTYANAVLSEAMCFVYEASQKEEHRKIAFESFDFLLSHTVEENTLNLISNDGWFVKGGTKTIGGEQAIDVTYTILALHKFYELTGNIEYLKKMRIAFNWFLGNNKLNQMVYNPVSGGCFDGLEDGHINQNQGAESTVCYLIARLTMEQLKPTVLPVRNSVFDIIKNRNTINSVA